MRKHFGAIGALKWLFTIVNAQVQSQVTRLAKCFGAFGALIWLFTGVHTHVSGQVT